jgi:alpha/beta superfamily hydrolase
MQNPVVNELAYGASRQGRASLRFDYEGVGASEGETSEDPEQATNDLRKALDHLLETTSMPRAAVAAYSFGTIPALRLAAIDPRIDRLMLVAPPRKMLAVPDYATVNVPITVVFGDQDTLVDAEAEKKLAEANSSRVRLEVIREADHSFRSGLVALVRITERLLGVRGS